MWVGGGKERLSGEDGGGKVGVGGSDWGGGVRAKVVAVGGGGCGRVGGVAPCVLDWGCYGFKQQTFNKLKRRSSWVWAMCFQWATKGTENGGHNSPT